MQVRIIPRGLLTSVFIVSVGFLGGCAGADQPLYEENLATATEALTEYAPDQAKANAFYAYDNIVSITINLSDETWTAIKTENPNPAPPNHCVHLQVNSDGETPDRYPYRTAGKVVVTDSKGTTNATFTSGVEIRKKSYCGSLTTGANEKPSLRLRFESSSAVGAMGVQYLTLNNSKQDDSYIRQTLGYYLFGLAGLPRPRANYAKVKIVTPSNTYDLVYVNVESHRASLIGNPDNNFTNRTITQSGSSDAKAPGNLYELEMYNDIDSASQGYIGLEKVSAIKVKPSPSTNPTSWGKPDLVYAAQQLELGTPAGFNKVINADQFAKLWAMEVLLKHWDGITHGKNNTYLYNDVAATSGTQSDSTVDFKFIPSGIDQILQPNQPFRISEGSVVSRIMRNDATLYAKFIAAVGAVRQSVFSRELIDGAINTRIELLRTQLSGMGITPNADINAIKLQLKLARAAAIMLSGSGSPSFYFADAATGEVMHASSTEQVGIYHEIYHRAPQNLDASDRWILGYAPGYGATLVNEAYNRPLYATASAKTPANHYYMFTEPNGNYPPGEVWNQWYDGTTYSDGGWKEFPATFGLRSGRTGRYAHFSTSDLTPQGRPRVYQSDTSAGKTPMFMY
jgi:hypothetical protein